MTTRELYNAIINGTEITDEMRAHATDAIEKLDKQAESRRVKSAEKAAEKQAAKAPLRDALFEVMGDSEDRFDAHRRSWPYRDREAGVRSVSSAPAR